MNSLPRVGKKTYPNWNEETAQPMESTRRFLLEALLNRAQQQRMGYRLATCLNSDDR